jgi:hypothetical protein
VSIITNEPSTAQVIANLHRRMTEAEYDVERAKINDAEGLRRLFQCCGWTQTRIAAKEGCAQSWVSRVVRGERVRVRAPLRMHTRSRVPLMKLDKDPRRGLYVHKVTTAYADRHWHRCQEGPAPDRGIGERGCVVSGGCRHRSHHRRAKKIGAPKQCVS